MSPLQKARLDLDSYRTFINNMTEAEYMTVFDRMKAGSEEYPPTVPRFVVEFFERQIQARKIRQDLKQEDRNHGS